VDFFLRLFVVVVSAVVPALALDDFFDFLVVVPEADWSLVLAD
jgi:hypothetical protein